MTMVSLNAERKSVLRVKVSNISWIWRLILIKLSPRPAGDSPINRFFDWFYRINGMRQSPP